MNIVIEHREIQLSLEHVNVLLMINDDGSEMVDGRRGLYLK